MSDDLSEFDRVFLRRTPSQLEHWEKVMDELTKFDVDELRALRDFDAADITELRSFLQERRATKWFLGRMKNIAVYAAAIVGALALLSQTGAEWFRHWLGIKP